MDNIVLEETNIETERWISGNSEGSRRVADETCFDRRNPVRSVLPVQNEHAKADRCICGSVITRRRLVMVDHRLSSIARLSDRIGYVADRFREAAAGETSNVVNRI